MSCRIQSTGRSYRPITSGATQIATLFGTGCARMTDGSARCWAIPYRGSPNGVIQYEAEALVRDAPVRNVVKVGVDGSRGYALSEDGYVYSWSMNWGAGGDAGTSTLTFGPIDRITSTNDATDLATGFRLAVVLRRDGAMLIRGDLGGWAAPLGPDSDVPMLPPSRAIAAGNRMACAIAMDGRVNCVGGFARVMTIGQTFVPFPQLDGAAELAIASEHMCARMPDRTVRCTGSNAHGELGDGTTMAHPMDAVTVGGADMVDQVLAGEHDPIGGTPQAHTAFSCARRAGTMLCWGSFTEREGGPLVDHLMPVAVTF